VRGVTHFSEASENHLFGFEGGLPFCRDRSNLKMAGPVQPCHSIGEGIDDPSNVYQSFTSCDRVTGSWEAQDVVRRTTIRINLSEWLSPMGLRVCSGTTS
jgi:hypothetical protein